MTVQWLEINIPYIVPPMWFVMLWVCFYAGAMVVVFYYKIKEQTYNDYLEENGLNVSNDGEGIKFIRIFFIAPITFLGGLWALWEQASRHKTQTPDVIKARIQANSDF